MPREQLEALAALPFLADVPRSELRHVASFLRNEDVEAGRLVVRQGARGDRFYVLLDGQVRVVRIAADEHEERLATLGPGDYFGEAALVANVPRTATVVAETPSRLLSLDAGHFRRWLASRVDVDEAVHRTLAEREHLARLPLFAGVGSAELDRLAAQMLVTRYSAGDTIVEQGAAGDRFFVIVDGQVEVVRRDEDGAETPIAELGVGDFFGEMALLDRAPRSATVRALSPVETYTLAADDFHGMLERPPDPRADPRHRTAPRSREQTPGRGMKPRPRRPSAHATLPPGAPNRFAGAAHAWTAGPARRPPSARAGSAGAAPVANTPSSDRSSSACTARRPTRSSTPSSSRTPCTAASVGRAASPCPCPTSIDWRVATLDAPDFLTMPAGRQYSH